MTRSYFLNCLIAMFVPLVIAGCAVHKTTPPTPLPSLPPPEISSPSSSVEPLPAIIEYGKASYYADKFDSKTTASGVPLDQHALTAACKYLPLGTQATVTSLDTSKSITVEVNDRGPYARNRIIDLSQRAALELGIGRNGVARVKITVRPEDQPTPELRDKVTKLAIARSSATAQKKKSAHAVQTSVSEAP